MKATMEINAATVRIFEPGGQFGDPFDFAIFIVGDEDTAILKGLRADDHRFTSRHKSAIMRCLLQAGFTRAIWHRWKRTAEGPIKRTFVLDINAGSRFVRQSEARAA
jgi:hypothetical protein